MKNNKLYNKIMESVSKQVKKTLDEVIITSDGSLTPKKTDITGEAYIILCTGVNKELLASVSSKLTQFDNQGAGSIKVICKTHEEVNKTIALLVDAGVLDADSFLGLEPKIYIKKVNKNSVNDSVNEGMDTEKQAINRQYIHPSKMFSPRQDVKLNIILKINNGEMPRDPQLIQKELEDSGLWATRSEGQVQMDVNFIMKKTAPKPIEVEEECSGDFVTDFIYSKDNYEPGEFANGMEAAENHVKWLIKHGLTVNVTEKRYSYLINIHYDTKQQYNDLLQWIAWDHGESDMPNNPCPVRLRKRFEELIKSGKSLTFEYKRYD